MRFSRPIPERQAALAADVGSSAALAALAEAAAAANTFEEVEAVALQRCTAVVEALRNAGVRQLRSGGSSNSRRHGIPAHIEEQFSLKQLRAVHRKARRNRHDLTALSTARRQLEKAIRLARQKARDQRAVRLEQQMLT
jgi:hypothetical protein